MKLKQFLKLAENGLEIIRYNYKGDSGYKVGVTTPKGTLISYQYYEGGLGIYIDRHFYRLPDQINLEILEGIRRLEGEKILKLKERYLELKTRIAMYKAACAVKGEPDEVLE